MHKFSDIHTCRASRRGSLQCSSNRAHRCIRQPGRETRWRTDAQLFDAAGFTLQKGNLSFGDSKSLGQKCDQGRIGLTVNRRSSKAEFQRIAVNPGKLIAAGSRLQLHTQMQVRPLPVCGVGQVSGKRRVCRAQGRAAPSAPTQCRPLPPWAKDRYRRTTESPGAPDAAMVR